MKNKQFDYHQKLFAEYESMRAKGMSNEKIVKIYPDMKLFVDDDNETINSRESQKRGKNKK